MTTNRLSDAAVRPLRTLDPAAPLDDLGWLDDAIGTARVVAIGESAHYNAESYRLRHRLLRYLVERHGFGAYALESGFVEGRSADAWVRGGAGDVATVQATGITSLMGLWAEMRAHLEWMRRQGTVGFYGIDLGGSNVSLLPGLDAVIAYLAEADPGYPVGPGLRETAAGFGAPSAFSAPAALSAYTGLAAGARDALTAGLSALAVRLAGRRREYLRRTTADAYDRALRAIHLAVALDAVARNLAAGDQQSAMLTREAAMADTVEWVLRREDRIVLAAHNGHLQRWPTAMPGIGQVTPLGLHLADRLGRDYRVIATTTGVGQTLNTGPGFYTGTLFTALGPPEPGSLDALMAASCDRPFAADLRRLSRADEDAVRAATRQRLSPYYVDVDALQAYDVLVHLPEVTAAEPDPAALAGSPPEVRRAFSYAPMP